MSFVAAGITAAEVAAAIAAAEAAAAAAAAAAANTAAIAAASATTAGATAAGAAGASLGATGTGLTVGSGLGATGLGGAGLGTTGLTVGSGLGATGGAGLGAAGSAAAGGFGTGAAGLGTLGTAAAAEGGIGALGATAGEVAGEKALEQGAKKGLEQVAKQAPADLDAMGQPAAQPNLSAVAEPKPITPSTPSSSGNNSFSSMDAFNRNAVNNINQGWKVGPSAPTVPAGTSSAGGEATKDAWVLALEDQGATAAQRTAMENSAKTFGDIGGKYESAITKTPVEKSLLNKAGEFVMDNKLNIALGGLGLMQMMPPESGVNPISESMIRPYTYSEEDTSDQEADPRGREKIRYSSSYTAGTPYKAAQGGLLSLHRGGNFLSGGGDGMSDDIPAMIGAKQPARLADGEFVIPADVVSHIGNGSSKAGAAKLYAMMDKIRQERTGRKRQSPQINAAKYLPR